MCFVFWNRVTYRHTYNGRHRNKIILLDDMEEDFIYDREKEYYLPDFFEKFKDKLPLLTIVISGHYGKTKFDDFSDDTIVRFHKYHNVQRVIARESCEASKLRLEYLSIPVSSYHRFHKVHGMGRTGPEQTMEEIIKDGLPVLVKFSLRTEPRVLSKARSDMVLTDTFEETYLQGNTFINGQIQATPIASSLSPHISVTPITGFKGKSEAEFEEYLSYLDVYIKENSVFRHTDCDLTVKRFKINEEGYERRIRSDENFPDTDTYSSPDLPPRKAVTEPSNEYTYDYVDATEWTTAENRETKSAAKKKEDYVRPKQNILKTYTKGLIDRAFSIIHPNTRHNRVTEKHSASHSKKGTPNLAGAEFDDGIYEIEDINKDGVYEIEDSDKGNVKKKSTPPVEDSSNQSFIYDMPYDEVEQKNTQGPESLSVEGVSKVLRQLRLDKYVEEFYSQAIDGELLVTLDESVLQSELKFSRLETIRLMKYITTGHIPK